MASFNLLSILIVVFSAVVFYTVGFSAVTLLLLYLLYQFFFRNTFLLYLLYQFFFAVTLFYYICCINRSAVASFIVLVVSIILLWFSFMFLLYQLFCCDVIYCVCRGTQSAIALFVLFEHQECLACAQADLQYSPIRIIGQSQLLDPSFHKTWV